MDRCQVSWFKVGGNLSLGAVTIGSSADTGSKIAGVGSVSLDAKNDINATLATVKAGATLIALAGKDINNSGSTLTAEKELLASAGRDVNIVSTTVSSELKYGGASFAGTHVDKVAGLYVTDENGGALNVVAGRDLNVATLATSSSQNYIHDEANYRKENRSGEAGSQIQAAGSLALSAKNDVNVRAGDVQAGAQLLVSAGNNINVTAGVATHHFDAASRKKEEGMWSSKTTTKRDTLDTVEALGSSLGGGTVVMAADKNLNVTGSAVVGDGAVSLPAGHDLTIAAATNSSRETHHMEVKESGFLRGGGFGLSYGKRTTTTDQERDALTQSGQARSGIGSAGGTLSLSAGDALKVGGSDLAAGLDMNLAGKSVVVDPGRDDVKGKFATKTVQDGFTLAVGGSVVNAIQTAKSMQAAAGNTKNKRVQAMAAATAALAAKDAAKSIAKEGVSVSLSLTAGHSESQYTQTTREITHSGSTLVVGNNLNISATGAGQDSNISIAGSDLRAGNNVTLMADNQIKLLAAQDSESQHSKSSSMSAAAGIGISYSSKGGFSGGFMGSVSASRGHEDGDGTTQTNSHVSAGKQLSISSGGDTTIKGAVAAGAQVVADVGGNLNIESLQDTAKFDSKTQSVSASVTGGYGTSVSGSFNQSKIHSDYASVQEQSGIQAGDGGFQIKVKGNTDLKGATISSTEAGFGSNNLTTATLTHSEIANHAEMEASSVGVSGGVTSADKAGDTGKAPGGTELASTGRDGGGLPGAAMTSGSDAGMTKSGASATPGVAMTSSSDASTTKSGISAGVLVITDDAAQRAATGKGADEALAGTNRVVATGVDSSGKISNNFDLKEVQATLEVTKAFMQAAAPLAANVVGNIGAEKEKSARREAIAYTGQAEKAEARGDMDAARAYRAQAAEASETAKAWGDNGIYRIGLHAAAQGLIGGLAGGGAGALGAAAGVAGGNLGQQLGKEMGEAEATKRGLEGTERIQLVNTYQQTMATLGGALGGLVVAGAGGQGASAGAAVDVYNRQLHQSEYDMVKKYKGLVAKTLNISQEEAEGRIVRQLERNVDGNIAQQDGGRRDEAIVSLLGCKLLQCDANKTDAHYWDSSYNNQYIKPNQVAYNSGAAQAHSGLTPQQIESRNNAAGAGVAKGIVSAYGVYVLAGPIGRLASEVVAFSRNPIAYCTSNPAACLVVADTAAGTVAGVPVTGVPIPHVVPTPSGTTRSGVEATKQGANSSAKTASSVPLSVAEKIDGPVLKTVGEMNFPPGNLKFSDSMSSDQYKKLVKSIEANGIQNKAITYVEIEGLDYIAIGNNRYMAAQRTGALDQLRFQKSDFPVPGTNWYTPQDILNASGTVKMPKIYPKK